MSESEKQPKFAWAEFLEARRDMIVYFVAADGKPFHEVARMLSCDPDQVELIYMGRNDPRPAVASNTNATLARLAGEIEREAEACRKISIDHFKAGGGGDRYRGRAQAHDRDARLLRAEISK